MCNIARRRPSHDISPKTHGLWSLWDMLDRWGYLYFVTGTALAYAETALEEHRKETGGAIAGHGTSKLNTDDQAALLVVAKCKEVLHLLQDHEDELGPIIPNQLKYLIIHLEQSRRPHALEIYTNDILDKVRGIKANFASVLSNYQFYYLSVALAKHYGKPELFGPKVAKKFPQARFDIQRAGNCLALGEPTACLLHLDRAMEIATRRLLKKLGVTPNAKDSWGMVLGKMTDPIKLLPDNKPAEKRKKEKWAECRTNLYHVKMAWRDPGTHGTSTYDHKEAADIFKRVDDFMQQLATLL